MLSEKWSCYFFNKITAYLYKLEVLKGLGDPSIAGRIILQMGPKGFGS
jgi:hypothetical protein